MIAGARQFLSRPRFDDREEDRVARLLHHLLLIFAGASLLSIAGSLLADDVYAARSGVAGALAGLVAFLVLRAGHPRAGAFLLLAALMGSTAYVLVGSNGIHTTMILVYPLLLFAGAALLRPRAFVALLAWAIACVAGVAAGEIVGWIHTPMSAGTGLGDILLVVLLLGLSAGVARLLSENLRRALSEARSATHELLLSNRQLSSQAEALETSEAHWRSLVAGATDIILTALPDGTIQFANRAAASQLGAGAPQIDGRNIFEFIPADPFPQARSALQAVIDSGKQLAGIVDVPMPDGGIHWLNVRIDPIQQEGQTAELLIVARDVTYSRATEEALRETEARLHAAIENLPFAFWICDAEGRYLMQNSTAVRQWGDQRGKKPAELDIPDWTKALWEDNNGRALRGETVRGEYAFTFADERRVYDAIVAPIREGNTVRGILGIDIDITERKRAEDAVRASEEQYRRLVEEIDEVIFSIDAAGRTTYVSPVVERLSGYSPSELLGHHMAEFVYEEDLPRVLDRLRSLADGDNTPMEVRLRTKSGEVRCVRVSGVPMIEGGQLAGLRGLMSDITARRHAEEALRALNADLEQRITARTAELKDAYERLKGLDRLKTKFVSDVSHELRTPVTNLGLYLSLLERGREEKRAEYLEVLREQTDRLGQLIEDILGWSRLDQEKERFAPGTVDLNALVRPLFDAHRTRLAGGPVTLTLDVESEECLAKGDRIQLAQVASNLMANALNYTKEGTVRLSTRSAGGWACLEIEDTGLGIDPEDLPHVFERFYRGSRAVQENIPGTGLGLAIVREIVELHGGHIDLESETGRGTSVRVWLPQADTA